MASTPPARRRCARIPDGPVEDAGPRSVTVPGAVAGWAALAERFGRLGLDAALEDAISAAENGFAVAVRTASVGNAHAALRPRSGARTWGTRRLPELGATLRRIAEEGPDAIYRGKVAEAIASCTWLDAEDLAAFRPRWVEPLRLDYRGMTVCELPPPTQGVAALGGLWLLWLGSSRHRRGSWSASASRSRMRSRTSATAPTSRGSSTRTSSRGAGARGLSTSIEPPGGTVYLCAVDGDRMAVSLIQSLYDSFGSGIVAPGTGIVLQNRGACFAVSGHVEPGRRPYHTIIPGMLLRTGSWSALRRHGRLPPSASSRPGRAPGSRPLVDPSGCSTRPRFRLDGDVVLLEGELWESAPEIEALGLRVKAEPDSTVFGGGQAIVVGDDVLLGGSDSRKDGYAAGF